jgi:hypothetical protein
MKAQSWKKRDSAQESARLVDERTLNEAATLSPQWGRFACAHGTLTAS